jgi:hypothetical protein
MIVYLSLDENNRVIGWSSSSDLSGIEIEVELAENDAFFNDPLVYRYENGLLILDTVYQLEQVKKSKNYELNSACRNSILDGFNHTINGVEYHFNYDFADQINFGDAKNVLDTNIITELPWTVYTIDGQPTRIMINKILMDELTLAIMNHKNGKISHYRDVLLPRLETATTIAEVEAITWDI